MTVRSYPRMATLRTTEAFRAHLAASGIDVPLDDELAPPAGSPLGRALEDDGVRIGNRFCVLPMEGWDGTLEGLPSDLTRRRWRHFGESGAKLVWGGEAVAVRHDGRASPNQLQITPATHASIAGLREDLVAAHRERFGSNADRDLFVGLQLTHSGRFAKPDAHDRPAPLAACTHPVLDERFDVPPHVVSDDELERLIDDFVAAARLAWDAGFGFVDVKQCHGYLGHELLGARRRAGKYGGDEANRFRWVTEVIEAIRSAVPGLRIGVRLSAFDAVPFRKDAGGVGEPTPGPIPTPDGFAIVEQGGGAEDLAAALEDSHAFLSHLEAIGVRWVCLTAGSAYYTPHLTRPAYFPPSDGYLPPEDPLRGVARHVRATAILKAAHPRLIVIGSGYTYLQQWLPQVAQHTVRQGMTDFVGLGRMMLAYPTLPADVLSGAPLRREAICRTFSDCTTGPRLGFVSGCYPLDPAYRARDEAATIQKVRTGMASKA